MYCTQCGTLNADGASFCTKCGTALGGAATAPAAAAPAAGPPVYAGFWLRVAAKLIDQVILIGAFMVMSFFLAAGMVGAASSGGDASPGAVIGSLVAFWAVLIAIPWLYDAFLESSKHQATVGKLACGIKVTDMNGERIGFGRATGRYFAEWITGFTFLIGYVIAGFTQRKQALHDMIASTLVVKKEFGPAQVTASAPATRMPGWAIALIIVATLIFPLGMLAAIAIPAYHDYTIRAQVSEGLTYATQFKAGVAEWVSYTGEWPADVAEMEFNDIVASVEQEARFVETIGIDHGTITITFGKAASPRISGKRLSLQPHVSGSGDVVWRCGNAETPYDSTPNSTGMSFEGTDSAPGTTELADRYLPASCRSGFTSNEGS